MTGSTLSTFPRYRKNGVVFASKQTKLRDSSVCMIRRVNTGSTSDICFGSIRKLCIIEEVPFVIVSVFDYTGENILVGSMNHSSLRPQDIEAAKTISSYIKKVKKLSLSQGLVAISTRNLLQKCVHIPMKYSPTDYIVTIPNIFEHH